MVTMKRTAEGGARQRKVIFVLLLCALIAVAMLSICLGSSLLPLGDVLGAIFGDKSVNPVIGQIVVEFRLPRVLSAMLGGGALAVAGLLMQTVFRNPLADPYVLGVNAGASLGVALVLLVLAPTGVALTDSLGLSGQLLIVVAATSGSIAALSVVLVFARKVDVMSLLIIGLMMSYVVGALVSILMFFSMAERLQTFFIWSYGDFGNVSWSQMRVFGPAIVLGLCATIVLIKPLNALLLGEHYAESLGTRVKPVRIAILVVASLLAGTVTGFCGPIGFLGIAAPHLCRYLFKSGSHAILIPGSILMGAILALSADMLSKVPGVDVALPLNAITALVGAPVIIVALVRQRNLKRVFG